MKNYNAQEEILIATGSSFARQELWENGCSANPKRLSEFTNNKIEEACWNGMLKEWLPAVVENTGEKIFLWKIFVANAFLCADLSSSPLKTERYYSLNPYLFLPSVNNN